MRKIIKEIVEREVEKIIDILCNKCGRSVYDSRNGYMLNGTKFKVDFGYGSEFDGNIYDVCLCDDCWVSIIDDFVYMPEKEL